MGDAKGKARRTGRCTAACLPLLWWSVGKVRDRRGVEQEAAQVRRRCRHGEDAVALWACGLQKPRASGARGPPPLDGVGSCER